MVQVDWEEPAAQRIWQELWVRPLVVLAAQGVQVLLVVWVVLVEQGL